MSNPEEKKKKNKKKKKKTKKKKTEDIFHNFLRKKIFHFMDIFHNFLRKKIFHFMQIISWVCMKCQIFFALWPLAFWWSESKKTAVITQN